MPQPLVRAILAALLVAAPAAALGQAGSPTQVGPSQRGLSRQGGAASETAPRREPSIRSLAARERQRKCGAEWRALDVADKAAQGPRWPQYYSKCVRRLKEQRA
ncbi:hypothetical protein VQ02_25840 [Methylobacterium variabile]|jgi:hypothetical protein|uniref:Uncharacterized protein n=1 Tax=Methylobacterium variabile TaxID=298794 RepID=A0A0J6SCX9_9HYPH|nr:hypothetical protein [Methylobacterium variabile]KMO31587.1 hypothetical protein VQ02_25840 [Methylobacterium variabile]